jgi:hypothetical protein
MRRASSIVRKYGLEVILLALCLAFARDQFWRIYAVGTVCFVILGHHLFSSTPTTPLKLQSSQPFVLDLGQQAELPAEVLYQASVALTIHSDAMSWTRLYTLLTANSIMMLAWATVYVGGTSLSTSAKGEVGVFLALPGLLLSSAWAPFGSRNRRLHRRWGNFYVALEQSARPNRLGGPGVAAEDLRYLGVEEWFKTGFLIIFVPLAFADVFFFVLLKSFFQWRGW